MSTARTKGTNFMWPVKFLRAQREQARTVVAPHLAKYLDSRILPSSWYPIADYWGLMRAVNALAGLGDETWTQLGFFLARTDLGGVYKGLLKPGDPARTLSAATILWRNYHDLGELVVEPDAAGACRVTLRDYPAPYRELCGLLGGYLPEMARLSGADGVAGAKLRCRLDGAAPDCQWNVTWRTAP